MSHSSEIYKTILKQLKAADDELADGEYLRLLDDVMAALKVKRESVVARQGAAVANA